MRRADYLLLIALSLPWGCAFLFYKLLAGEAPPLTVAFGRVAIAAAVIGGASLSGGVGTVAGTMIGAFIIGILRNGLNMSGVSAFIQQIVIGFVVIGAVWIDQVRNRR